VSKYFELLQRAGQEIAPSTEITRAEAGHPSWGIRPERDARSDVRFSEERKSDSLRLLEVVVRHYRLAALFAAVVFFSVVVFTLLTKPVYQATARIEVDPPGEMFSLEGSGPASSDAEYLETQAQNLQSANLALSVIRQLQLDQDPEIAASDKNIKQQSPDPLQLNSNEAGSLGRFQKALIVKRDSASRLISVSFQSRNPRLAAEVSNKLVDTFIYDTFRTRHEAIMKSSEWLSRQLDDIRAKMENSTRALAEMQGSMGVADVDENKSTYTEHMSELSRQFTQAESERIQLQALLKNLPDGHADSLPEVRNSPVVQQIGQRLAQQRAELAQALVTYGKNHPNARKLQSEVDELQVQLDMQKKAIVNSLRASYAAAEARQRLMQTEMKGTTKQLGEMARYSALKKEVQSEVELYNSLYSRIKEAGIAAASKSATIRVVDQARVPALPARPRPLLNLSVGFLIAVLGGIAVAFLREEFDNRLRTPEDITRWIGQSNVSIIPVIEGGNGTRKLPALLFNNSKRAELARTFVLDSPDSPETEAMHSLQASIMLSHRGNSAQVLLVASSFPGEGKTTVALNLALALAEQGETCLVDADLRKRNVTARFGLSQRSGLADYLQRKAGIDDILQPSGVNRLTVIPAGTALKSPGQITCSPNAPELFRALRSCYRFVVIDSVPVLPFADGRAFAPFADAIIFVGRAGVTTREAMRRSLQLLADVHAAPILEFVLNAADTSSPGYEYYKYGYESYQKQSAASD
jgi:succinoglycan biosynthesis transport protein ExoP